MHWHWHVDNDWRDWRYDWGQRWHLHMRLRRKRSRGRGDVWHTSLDHITQLRIDCLDGRVLGGEQFVLRTHRVESLLNSVALKAGSFDLVRNEL